MNRERHERLEAWFHAVHGLRGDERGAMLRGFEREDAGLAAELRAMLGATELDERTGTAARALRTLAEAAASGQGERIGPYRVLDLVGEGAIGAVYAAEQREPVRRLVALKVLKPGMDSREVVRRFDAERSALSRLDHPNISPVLDAGLTPEGRPYIAMPLVQGTHITAYCDEAGMGVGERVALFTQVCAAMRHAHQRGIIHRDLKPSNILIVSDSTGPVAKVIDFGIAKALDDTDTLSTYRTEAGRALGTPGYMSPEQAAGATGAIDTRTDVYSLGAVLYELLCGRLPHDPGRLRVIGPAAWAQEQQDYRPLPPSGRWGEDEESRLAAAARAGTWQGLRRSLSKDLDRIVLRCLSPEPDRRYATVDALMDDLDRWRRGLPVLAATTGTWYVVGKFVRRHRGAVAACAVLAVGMVAGGIGTAWYAVKADRSAKSERFNARVTESILDSISPTGVKNGNRGVLQAAIEAMGGEIPSDLEQDEAGLATVSHIAGVVLANKGQHALAEARFAEAEQGRKKSLGENAFATLETCRERALNLLGMEEWDRAEALAKRVAEAPASAGESGRAQRARGLAVLAAARLGRGEGDQAIEDAERAANELAALAGSDARDTLRAFGTLAGSLAASGQGEVAVVVWESLVSRARVVFGGKDALTLSLDTVYADCLAAAGRHAEAVGHLTGVEADMVQTLGPDHPIHLAALRRRGLSLLALRERYEGVEYLTAAFEGYGRVRGYVHRTTEAVLAELVSGLIESRRFADAKGVLLKARAARFGELLSADGKDEKDVVIAREMLRVLDVWGRGGEMQEWWVLLPPDEAKDWREKKRAG